MSAPDSQDAVAEIRQTELKGRQRKQLIIIGSSSVLLVLAVIVVVAIVGSTSKISNNPNQNASASEIRTSTKSVEMFCSSTDYRNTCESSLSQTVKADNPEPQELVKAAISVIYDEVGAAFNKTLMIKSKEDDRLKGAIEDCRELYIISKDELQSSLDVIVDRGMDHLNERSNDIRIWLSAVMSYQQTCIDGFPDEDSQKKVQNVMTRVRELTSNGLAIIRKASEFLAMLNADGLGGKRRLLEEGEAEDEFPEWVSEEERRVLKEETSIKLRANVTVAKDGSGQFKTISAALEAMPEKRKGRYVIHVKPGVYEETVIVNHTMKSVTMYGDSPQTTIITGSKNYVDGTRTFRTATFAAVGEGFMAIGLTFRNTAGAIKHQAVALRVQSDRSIFYNCHMEGYQDTLYAQTHRQFYRGCVISGTIDFIFGDAAAVLQNCVLVVRRPLDNQNNIVTAQGRMDRHETTGFVIQRCRIVADPALKSHTNKIKTYLGRPWKAYSKLVTMESEIGGLISPEGYLAMNGDFGLKTLQYAEYKNTGPGADVKGRVKWPGVKTISKEDAVLYTAANFLQAGDWVRKSGVDIPIRMGLYS